jgi:hypothetical protein
MIQEWELGTWNSEGKSARHSEDNRRMIHDSRMKNRYLELGTWNKKELLLF